MLVVMSHEGLWTYLNLFFVYDCAPRVLVLLLFRTFLHLSLEKLFSFREIDFFLL